MTDFFDEINNLEYLFLLNIEEPVANQLSINISEATASGKEEYMIIGEKTFGKVKGIISNDQCARYNVRFNTYVAYCVLNESFKGFNDYENRKGRLFCIFSKSDYLDYVRKETFAEEIQDGELKHYAINCSDNIIYIASMDEPLITRR